MIHTSERLFTHIGAQRARLGFSEKEFRAQLKETVRNYLYMELTCDLQMTTWPVFMWNHLQHLLQDEYFQEWSLLE